MRQVSWTFIAFWLTIASANSASAQAAAGCGRDSVASYGIAAVDCVHCTVRQGLGGPVIEYGAEPVIREITPGIAGVNQLMRSDVIVALDGAPITTSIGAAFLASPVPGKVVRFDVRRDGKPLSVPITPRCVANAASYTRAGRAGSNEFRGAPALPNRPGAARGSKVGRGSLGFIFVSVSMAMVTDRAGSTASVYRELPIVRRVDAGGPAERAGLLAGDIVRAVDDLPLTTIEGTKRLGGINPQERVKMTVLRGDKVLDIYVTAGGR